MMVITNIFQKKNYKIKKLVLDKYQFKKIMIKFNKVYIQLGKITYLPLHSLPLLLNLKNTKISFKNLYEKQ